MKFTKKQIINSIKVSLVLAILVIGLNFVGASWSGPSVSAPDGNIATPINVGSSTQVKNGGIGLDALSVFGEGLFTGKITANQYCLSSGECLTSWDQIEACEPIDTPNTPDTPSDPVLPSPTVLVIANPDSIAYGESTTISWASTNTNSCSASWTTSTETSGTETKTNLVESEIYSMTCVGEGGTETGSDSIIVGGAPVVPGSPSTLNLLVDNLSIDVEWAEPSDDGGSSITGYVLQRKEEGGSYMIVSSDVTLTSYVDTNLDPNTKYFYKVAAKNAIGTGEYSSEKYTTTKNFPGIPNGLDFKPYQETKAELSWNVPSSDGGSSITGYVLQRKLEGGSYSIISPDTESPEYFDLSAHLDTVYVYRVAAENAVGIGDYSSPVSFGCSWTECLNVDPVTGMGEAIKTCEENGIVSPEDFVVTVPCSIYAQDPNTQ